MIKNNSREIKKNDIFIATHTSLEDRHKYIKSAINNGASAIICDKKIDINIPSIKVENTNKTYFQIYNDLFKDPFKNIKLIGITGTDGKTTTSYITKQLLNNFYNTAYLGTNGLEYNNTLINTKNTTPDIVSILKIGKTLKENNIKYLVMEASSEGLLNNRLEGLNFDITGVTNITCDHLNIHKSIKNYVYSKLKLFTKLNKNGYSILNKNDKYYKLFKKNCRNVITYGEKLFSSYRIKNIKIYQDKTEFLIKHKFKKYKVKTSYVGRFNVYNLTLAIIIVNKLGIKLNDIIKCIPNIKDTRGRVNFLDYKQDYKIILDYAHTTNATLEILKYANEIKKNKIITLLGCAGGRFKEKRKEIGKIATDYSDIVIFTMDDPRYEKVEDIFKDIVKCVTNNNYLLIKNRKKAIKKALSLAEKNDIVLILGKGIDNYMAVKNKYLKYNDLETITKYFNSY